MCAASSRLENLMKKTGVKFIAVLIVVIIVLGLFSGVFAMLASAASDDADLTALAISAGTLDPSFNSGTTSYTASVDNSVSSLNVTPTLPSTSKATIQVATDSKTSDVDSGKSVSVDLDDRYNTIKVEVTSEDKTTKKTYTVTVYRSPSASAPESILTADTTVSRTMTTGKAATGLTITFYLWELGSLRTDDAYDFRDISMPSGSSFSWGESTKLKISKISSSSPTRYKAVLSNVMYNGGSSHILELYVEDMYFEIPISSKYFRADSSGDGEAPTPDIVVQSVNLKNASGQTLDKVTKDTAPFTVEITFYDVGLKGETKTTLSEARIHAFITAATGFKTLSGTGGTVEVLSTSEGFPRFKVTFKNIQSDGTSNKFGFRIQYDLMDQENSVKGEATAELFQVETTDKEDEDEIAPLKPNVIVQSYSYGGEVIAAGGEFELSMEFSNTSKNVPVENVVMTIEPGNGFIIAASSNTMYVSSLSPGEAKPYSVALRAAASGSNTGGTAGAQTDYSVHVKFEYQYLSKKEYQTGTTELKIAIPVVQLDRFSVDEITDYSQYLTAGDEGYVTVPITNKGKSPTYNISAYVQSSGGGDFTSPATHYGNLEAGKSASVDLSIIIRTPGEFEGEAVVSYEDENMSQKQLTVPFSIMVTEPYIPPETPQDYPGEEEPAGVHLFNIIICGFGALLVACPIAMYLTKRVRARGSEDIDEDF